MFFSKITREFGVGVGESSSLQEEAKPKRLDGGSRGVYTE